ncbi:MAG TPA: hypothetical protein VG993_00360 [Actinomycetota bacterium]|jgi:hypothetical protein|nr:hypothetical protein [Actinomycetota bacterium]
MRSGPTGAERRCPDCGALASPDAEWCGQCFRSLAESAPDQDPGAVSGAEPERQAMAVRAGPASAGSVEATGAVPRAPSWPCPTCGNDNDLELDACAVCGTTFASLMRQDETPDRVDPKEALSASLLFPGLGHRKVGRGLDGLARGVLFAVLAVMAATVLVSGVSSAGTFGVFALFLAAALLVYLGTAYEAHHLASGGSPIVSSRTLLWATVVVIIGSVMLLAVSLVTTARR